MGTQGVLSITDGIDIVRFKVVCGLNGYNMPDLALALSEYKLSEMSVDMIYEHAEDHDVGTPESLVVMSETGERYDADDVLSPLYRLTFKNPWFNPRWENGTADHVLCLDADTGKIVKFVDPRYADLSDE